MPHAAQASSASRNGFAVFEPSTDEQKSLLRKHLETIFASPYFRNSKRYAGVLRYVVERTLEGSSSSIKERSIGIDVFGREPDYDTASDHVVRSAMTEVRKRLAQYYQEAGDASEVRIDVLPGSYVPQFQALVVERIQRPVARPIGGRWILAAGLAGAAVLSVVFLSSSLIFGLTKDSLHGFWRPVFESQNQILLCIGNLEGGQRLGPAVEGNAGQILTLRDFHHMSSQTVLISDAKALAKLAGLLEANKKPYRIATQSEADFGDLQNGPAILIGLLNNEWAERLVGKLRFSIERPEPRRFTIRDRNDPARKWSLSYLTPLMEVTKDYALVLRVLDPKTNQMVVTAGGISVFGTMAAAEFLTSERELRKLDNLAPAGWQTKNAEILLSTEVIRGKSGLPKIEATHFW